MSTHAATARPPTTFAARHRSRGGPHAAPRSCRHNPAALLARSDNTAGQLGINSTSPANSITPLVRVGGGTRGAVCSAPRNRTHVCMCLCSPPPAQMVVGGASWLQVSGGQQSTCAVRQDNTTWCWGERRGTGRESKLHACGDACECVSGWVFESQLDMTCTLPPPPTLCRQAAGWHTGAGACAGSNGGRGGGATRPAVRAAPGAGTDLALPSFG